MDGGEEVKVAPRVALPLRVCPFFWLEQRGEVQGSEISMTQTANRVSASIHIHGGR
jgi:hypothetical protein